MIKYTIESSDKNHRPAVSFENEYWWLSELNSCDTNYIINDVLPNLDKVMKGELSEYEFGYDATIIDFHRDKSIISYGYDEGKLEVISSDIYAFMCEWREYLIKWDAGQ
ncbi:hypothetical protein [Ohtaekwangia koreensis]|uniref:Uncharacterized protein n=1 Tax=Ohtaekwangia koreensis TaxID=688867 RepID=A0A1T5M1F8_9BACT|nr:hypothetical protein [Ohtaekwangia koreensis]SKC81638.1 hypothetical protein SAMN05660236_3990 [Ohtaekwangia koreensis]